MAASDTKRQATQMMEEQLPIHEGVLPKILNLNLMETLDPPTLMGGTGARGTCEFHGHAIIKVQSVGDSIGHMIQFLQ